jgi:hypothetical protein
MKAPRTATSKISVLHMTVTSETVTGATDRGRNCSATGASHVAARSCTQKNCSGVPATSRKGTLLFQHVTIIITNTCIYHTLYTWEQIDILIAKSYSLLHEYDSDSTVLTVKYVVCYLYIL